MYIFYFNKDPCIFFTISCWILLTKRKVSYKVVQKIKTHFMFNNLFFRQSYHLWIMWTAVVGSARQATDGDIIWRMRFACWMTDTLATCNAYCFSTTTMVKRKRLNITLHIHCLSLLCNSTCFTYCFPSTYYWTCSTIHSKTLNTRMLRTSLIK